MYNARSCKGITAKIEEITENETLQNIIDSYDEHRKKCENLAYLSGCLICTIVGIPFAIYTFVKSYQHEKAFKRIKKEAYIKSLEGDEKGKYKAVCEYIEANKKWLDYF